MFKAEAAVVPSVTRTVRVPDPVYEQLSREAEKRDVSRGAVVRDWQRKAEQYDQLEERHR